MNPKMVFTDDENPNFKTGDTCPQKKPPEMTDSFDSLSTRTYRAEQKNDQAIRILLENETMYCTTHTYVYQRFSK